MKKSDSPKYFLVIGIIWLIIGVASIFNGIHWTSYGYMVLSITYFARYIYLKKGQIHFNSMPEKQKTQGEI